MKIVLQAALIGIATLAASVEPSAATLPSPDEEP